MAHGLKIFNDSGDVQIDDAYRNLLLVASGTVSSAPTGSGASISYPTQSLCPPLILVRPHSDSKYVAPYLSIGMGSAYISCDGPFDYAVYGLSGPVADTGASYGLKVFDSAGNLVFGSMYEAVRVMQLLAVDMVWPDIFGVPASEAAYPYVVSYTSFGSRPWICLNSLLWYPDGVDTQIAAAITGSSVTIKCGSYFSGWTWFANNGAGGSYTRSFPGGKFRLIIAQR